MLCSGVSNESLRQIISQIAQKTRGKKTQKIEILLFLYVVLVLVPYEPG